MTANDNTSASPPIVFSVVIEADNDAPTTTQLNNVLSTPLDAGAAFTSTDLSSYFSDPEGGSLTHKLSGDNVVRGLTFTINDDATMLTATGAATAGEGTLAVVATDSGSPNKDVTLTLSLTVTSPTELRADGTGAAELAWADENTALTQDLNALFAHEEVAKSGFRRHRGDVPGCLAVG